MFGLENVENTLSSGGTPLDMGGTPKEHRGRGGFPVRGGWMLVGGQQPYYLGVFASAPIAIDTETLGTWGFPGLDSGRLAQGHPDL